MDTKYTMKYPLLALSCSILLASPFSFAADDGAVVSKIIPYQPGITMTKSVQAGISPAQAIDILKAGNARFLSGQQLNRNEQEMISITSSGQYPLANVIACMDSRSAPEVVFDLSKGDIFVNRIAGNVVDKDILGGMEYGAKIVGAPLIVVMGHTNCGAIKGACDGVKLGNLTQLLDKIKPAIQMSKVGGKRDGKNAAFVSDVTELNVDVSINTIRTQSPILAEMEKQGKIKIVGAMYDTSTGRVIWR